jgi:hypothetical protein
MRADVTFLEVSPREFEVSAFNIGPKGRWYAKGCTFRQSRGIMAPFQVTRGGALALESSSVVYSKEILGGVEGCALGRCTYEDETPAKGTYFFAFVSC